MMTIMSSPKPRTGSVDRKAQTRERIVGTAARIIRRTGYAGTGVADIMKEAGLTHGGFYAHFANRDDLLAAAADAAGSEGVASLDRVAAAAPAGTGFDAIVDAYLGDGHLQRVETGCPVAALGSEMHRQAPEVRAAATRRIKELIDLLARQRPDWGQASAQDAALVAVSTLLGALTLARAVDDPTLAANIRRAAREQLRTLRG
jgi:TetR/AcrR family transcriptional repressor of nem operon